jgi:hypothetical protein
MTRTSNSINPAEQLADLAALHCVMLPTKGSDRDRALAAAADCFHLANWWPSEAELAEEFLALAEALPAEDAEHSPPPTSHDFVQNPPPSGRPRQPRIAPPDGLKTAAQAAARLGCSIKTLDGYVRAGAIGYVIIGHGKKRPRRMFTDADLNAFIQAQTRKESSCPSTRTSVRRSGNLTSGGEVIAFTGVPRPRPGGKRKR